MQASSFDSLNFYFYQNNFIFYYALNLGIQQNLLAYIFFFFLLISLEKLLEYMYGEYANFQMLSL